MIYFYIVSFTAALYSAYKLGEAKTFYKLVKWKALARLQNDTSKLALELLKEYERPIVEYSKAKAKGWHTVTIEVKENV